MLQLKNPVESGVFCTSLGADQPGANPQSALHADRLSFRWSPLQPWQHLHLPGRQLECVRKFLLDER